MNKQGEGKIEYLTHTWSPVTGCLHGCSYCYMQRMAKRFPQISMVPKYHPERIVEPAMTKKPSRIGVSFTGDLFGEWVPVEWISNVLNVCKCIPKHRFLLLTKNPKRYGEFVIPGNCWTGTSVTGGSIDDCRFENARVEQLIEGTKRGRRFLSLEPFMAIPNGDAGSLIDLWIANMDWLIVGGLTGKGKGGVDQEDLELILDACEEHNVRIFIKNNAQYFAGKIQEYPADLILGE